MNKIFFLFLSIFGFGLISAMNIDEGGLIALKNAVENERSISFRPILPKISPDTFNIADLHSLADASGRHIEQQEQQRLAYLEIEYRARLEVVRKEKKKQDECRKRNYKSLITKPCVLPVPKAQPKASSASEKIIVAIGGSKNVSQIKKQKISIAKSVNWYEDTQECPRCKKLVVNDRLKDHNYFCK